MEKTESKLKLYPPLKCDGHYFAKIIHWLAASRVPHKVDLDKREIQILGEVGESVKPDDKVTAEEIEGITDAQLLNELSIVKRLAVRDGEQIEQQAFFIILNHLSTLTKERDEALAGHTNCIKQIDWEKLRTERDELRKASVGLFTELHTNKFELSQKLDELRLLRTQLELEQSKVARCVDTLKKVLHWYDVPTIHLRIVDFLEEQPLPTTPNLVQRVKELESLSEELSDAKHSFELHFLAGYEAGYENGGNDCAEHNAGVASKHYSSKEREKKNAWKDYKETLNHEQNKGG